MELKVVEPLADCLVLRFQSHLYGIERNVVDSTRALVIQFQSHLYGIERRWIMQLAGVHCVSIAPLWN